MDLRDARKQLRLMGHGATLMGIGTAQAGKLAFTLAAAMGLLI